ncbi:probable conserved hypothetical Ustilaginaceae-specific protein [Melanopsichium pennsylvanicum]|uniref:Probable conserved hypothetical Ustilaginaceae-specific protein n=2 Tax=Melanopsichium pennsylvanicum TaxID=63383 RepID=A0AAJ4XGX1_9BASI|nr:conserved hypothetical ustilaginaceae-specific protein [Melanopsichium pennsylvanicum 4]SNX82265.1 probable conserved hypothetical Ustilaginaceae-specific protein [Melanopsichium pennsylvanicum]
MPPKAKALRHDPAPSASLASAASPTRLASNMRNSSSTSLSSLPPIEVKPQKACVLCRRSKVKCIHDGAPPCKRCEDTNQEAQCKFRLRADDETWRERTDEVLSELAESVEWLVRQQQQRQQQPQPQQTQYQNIDYRRSETAASSNSPGSIPSLRKSHPNAGLYRPPLPLTRASGPNAWAAQSHTSQPDHIPPHQNHMIPHNAPLPHGRPSSNTYLGFDGASGLLSAGDSHIGPISSPSSSGHSNHKRHRSSSSASLSLRSLHSPHPTPPSLPAPTIHQPHMTDLTTLPSVVQTPYLASSHRSANAASPSVPIPRPPSRRHHPQNVPVLEPGQSQPSSIIYAAQQPYINAGQSSRSQPINTRTETTSPYARPSHYIGRNDPRLIVISMGLVSMDQARHLFKFFARYLQPHCFGFPSYPANEHMTPLIIACILMVSSMHEPNSRQLFERFRHEAFSSPLLLDQPIDRNAPLDPELGIGVEEITGACIAASWLGGQTALSIARLARYWAIGYLEHFEVRSAQTLGEWMTILPPFRQIDLVGKLRIWLMSYITEGQQAVINNKPSLFPESQPAHYCQGLMNASSHSAELTRALAQSDGVKKASEASNNIGGTPNSTHSRSSVVPPPPSDGADLQRSARAAVSSAHLTPPDQAAPGSNMFGPSHMAERWREWMEELNRWRLHTSQHSDLSDNSPESVDLSLLYHLSRTFLASHPLDSELGILDETHHALKAASNANPPEFSRLAIAQLRTISTAKHSALFALKLATTEFGEKLSYLPQFYHWLLSHAAGLLLLLIQRKETFLMAKEAESLLEVTKKFVQLYVFRVTSHSFHSAAADEHEMLSSNLHPRTGIKRSASDAELREGNGEETGRGRHANNSGPSDRNVSGNGDSLDFQWPFASGFPTTQARENANITSGITDPIAQQNAAHGNAAEKHPALANAQALARALYLVKMQVQSLDVQL